MENQRHDWLSLVTNPTNNDSNGTLGLSHLISLFDLHLLEPKRFMESESSMHIQNLPYEWLDDEQKYSRNKKEEDTTLPTWVHWFLKKKPDEMADCATFLTTILPSKSWIQPIFKSRSVLDFVAFMDEHKTVEIVLKSLDKEHLREIQNRPAERHGCSINKDISPEMADVLVKNGWDPDQKDANGERALFNTTDEVLFLRLLELGANPRKAKERVSKISNNSARRQALMKVINQKEAERSGIEKTEANWLEDELSNIINSGTSGNFQATLTKLVQQFPEGRAGGLLCDGKTIGAAMLHVANRMSGEDRKKTKLKSYLTLCDILIKEQGNGWIDLEQNAKNLPGFEAFSNRDLMLMGAVVMMVAANKTFSEASKRLGSTTYMTNQVRDAIVAWIDEKKLSPLLAAWNKKTDANVNNSDILEAIDEFATDAIGMAADRWWKGVSTKNPIMNQIHDQYGNQPKNLEGWRNEEHAKRPMQIRQHLKEAWPEWLQKKISSLHQDGRLDDTWLNASVKQWQSYAISFMLGAYQDTKEKRVFQELSWVTEDKILSMTKNSWTNWLDDVYVKPIQIESLPGGWKEEIESTYPEKTEITLASLITPGFCDISTKDKEDQATIALLRRLPLQTIAFGWGQREETTVVMKNKI